MVNSAMCGGARAGPMTARRALPRLAVDLRPRVTEGENEAAMIPSEERDTDRARFIERFAS